MNSLSAFHFCIAGAAVMTLSTIAFAAAQQNPQGQFHLSYSPVPSSVPASHGSMVTYSPIKYADGKTIQLRGEDGVVYVFSLSPDTIFCHGETKVNDWTYLKSVPKKSSITVLTMDEANIKASVVWDKEPTITTEKGQIVFALPPMCR